MGFGPSSLAIRIFIQRPSIHRVAAKAFQHPAQSLLFQQREKLAGGYDREGHTKRRTIALTLLLGRPTFCRL